MNLKDLNNIDVAALKNIDWSQVRDYLRIRPDLTVNVLLVLATLITMFASYGSYKSSMTTLKRTAKELDEKMKSFEKLQITQKQHDEFLKNAPEAIKKGSFVETISELAIKRDIQIISFSPVKERNNTFVNLASIEVNVTSNNYANLVLFMRDIESSPFAIRVLTWSGKTSSSLDRISRRSSRSFSQKATDKEIKPEFIEATINIESVELDNV